MINLVRMKEMVQIECPSPRKNVPRIFLFKIQVPFMRPEIFSELNDSKHIPIINNTNVLVSIANSLRL